MCWKMTLALDDLSNKICVPNKTEDLNLSVFNMITGKDESKTLTKYISCKWKCKFDGRKCNSDQKCNNGECGCECKKHQIWEKDYSWNPARCSCKNGKYYDSVILCDELYKPQKQFKQILMK